MPRVPDDQCPICGQEFDGPIRSHRQMTNGGFWYHCAVCGRFCFHLIFAHTGLPTRFNKDRHLLQGHIRERFDRWSPSDDELPDDPVFNSEEDIDAAIEQAPRTVPDRADKLLAAAIRRTDWFGERVDLDPSTDIPLAYAKNEKEFMALRRFLVESGYVHEPKSVSRSNQFEVTVTASGMEHDRMRKVSNAESEVVFVAMRFNDELNAVYKAAIDPAIRECGFGPRRVDLEEHNDDIVDRMLALIRESRFVVSDFTEHRHGVYFEAGFALGLGLPVVWCCKADQIKDAHFDTEHFNHVTWNDAKELHEKLKLRIQATIGRGPLKIPEHE